jgi:hypothetical protein
MKNTIYILSLIFLLGCGDYKYVRFETAQPNGVNESKSFNRKVIGIYINCSNPDEKLTITNNQILNSRTLKLKIHRNDLDFDSTITIDRSIDNELKTHFSRDGYNIEIKGDTINASQTRIDTVFMISENQVLKKFKGSYFLNFKQEERFWEVSLLKLIKDTLLIGQIFPSDTLLRFDFVTKTEEFNSKDSTTKTEFLINPSKREFKKLMKPNYFEKCGCYYKKR